MSQILSAGMDLLSDDLMRAGELCEAAVSDLVSAYTQGAKVRKALLEKMQRIQRLQDEADEVAAEIIIRLQPQASDLRFVKSCQKLTLEFSRLVKYAYDISDFVTRHHPTDDDGENIKRVAERTRKLIEMGIRSIQKKDLMLGEELRRMKVPRHSAQREVESVGSTSSALLLSYLDGVSAHATSLGNSARYITTGEGS